MFPIGAILDIGSKVIDKLLFIGKKSVSSRFPQYLISAILVLAIAVAFIKITSFTTLDYTRYFLELKNTIH